MRPGPGVLQMRLHVGKATYASGALRHDSSHKCSQALQLQVREGGCGQAAAPPLQGLLPLLNPF